MIDTRQNLEQIAARTHSTQTVSGVIDPVRTGQGMIGNHQDRDGQRTNAQLCPSRSPAWQQHRDLLMQRITSRKLCK